VPVSLSLTVARALILAYIAPQLLLGVAPPISWLSQPIEFVKVLLKKISALVFV
jgi:hypothetical protein